MAGVVFIAHGIPKFYDVSGGYGFFQSINLPPELFIPIALLEVIGGLAILFGILTRIASAIFIIEMIGAILTVKLSDGFVGGYEFELLLISICITLVILGPGRVSIENYVLRREIFPKGKQLIQETYNTEMK
jgi:putative oxidoreductase